MIHKGVPILVVDDEAISHDYMDTFDKDMRLVCDKEEERQFKMIDLIYE